MLRKIINYLLGLKLLRYFLRKKIFVFVYHDVSDENSLGFSNLHSTTIQNFTKNLNYFKENFKLISIEELNKNEILDNGPYAIITFDDGLSSVKSNATPILEKFNIPYTLFINEGAVKNNFLWNIELINNLNNETYLLDFYQDYIDKSNLSTVEFKSNPLYYSLDNLLKNKIVNENKTSSQFYLTIEDLNFLSSQNVTIGDHSRYHFNLNNIDLTNETDLISSSIFLKNEFNIAPTYFAIPFGKKEHYNAHIINYLFRQGYKYIFTTNPIGFESKDYINKTNCILPRIGLTCQSDSDLNFLINRTLFKKVDI